MKISVHWLRKFVDFPETTEELAEMLTMLGFEAEIPESNWENKNIVSARVLECIPHPNADKLKLCQIDDGDGDKQVVCGAPNVDTGQTVAYARIGTNFSNGFKIKKMKIRGEESAGMICSERELGISDEHEGIMVLDENIDPGLQLSKCISPFLETLELDITPNRPDSMSHLGIAREIAAKCNRKLKSIPVKVTNSQSQYKINISLENDKGCPRYIAGVMKNIKMGNSPSWMAESLISAGMRPINSLVDISNYVLLEMGHPTHIFDLKYFPDNKVSVRNANSGEKITTLDGQECKLIQDHLLITNGKDPVALAGIMGGEKSAVSNETNSILIESAYFDPVSIRKGAKNLGMSTESSKRFERGADPNGCVTAFWRVVELVNELCGGELVSKMTDAYPEKINQPEILLDSERINRLSGINIPERFTKTVLTALSVKMKSNGKGRWTCIPPSFRPDLTREIDLIEEIIRVYGYDKIPSGSSYTGTLNSEVQDPHRETKNIQNMLKGLGYNQCYSNTLQSEIISRCNGDPVKVMNPQSDKMTHLRTSLIPGLLETLGYNVNNGRGDIQLFEMGSVHFDDVQTSLEKMAVSGIVYGSAFSETIHNDGSSHSIFTIKGHIETLMRSIFKRGIKIKREDDGLFTPGFSITHKKTMLGKFGKISDNVLKNDLEIDLWEVFGFELLTNPLLNQMEKITQYTPVSKYPKIERELNFILPNTLDSGEIITLIKKSGKGLIKSLNPVNLYRHESLGNDKKSMVFKMIFQSESKTLEDSEVNSIIDQIIKKVTSQFKAELRA
jgi:phenylalanyl-tRNA synthetase beta chain